MPYPAAHEVHSSRPMGPRPCARPREGVKIDGVGIETRKVRMYVYVCMYVCVRVA